MNNIPALPALSFQISLAAILGWLLLPLLAIVAVSFGVDDAARHGLGALTLRWYRAAWDVASFRSGLRVSAIVAALSTVAATLIGVAAAVGLSRWRTPWRGVVDNILLLPILVPGLVVGIGMLTASAAVGFESGILRLVAGHALVIMPYVIRTTYASLITQGQAFEDAARTMGASEVRILARITLPLARPGIVAGMLFAFIVSLDEVPVSLFLSDARSTTLPLAVLSYLQYNFDPAISAVSAAQVLLTVAAAIVLERLFGLKNLYGAERVGA